MRPTWSTLAVVLALLCTANGAAAPVAAQVPLADADRIQLSRDELSRLLEQYEAAERSSGYSAAFRARAADQARGVRLRLEQGDFRVGDQIVLSVRGDSALNATFTVQDGRTLVLPEIGGIPLHGVLRSELQTYLTGRLARYIRNPAVETRALFRILVTGAVARPGFYVVPAQALVSEAIMAAGGFTATADLGRVQIVRHGEQVWGGEELKAAIAEGRTFDQLGTAAGDEIVVPTTRTAGSLGSIRAIAATLPALMLSIAAIARIF